MAYNYVFWVVIGFVVWGLIPFRQYKKRYFYFFYFWICGDVFTTILRFLHSGSNFFYIPFSFLAFVSLFDKDILKKNKTALVTLFVITIIISMFLDSLKLVPVGLAVIHFLIFIKFLEMYIKRLTQENILDIFLTVILFYEITIITKNIIVVTDIKTGIIYFILTSIFEVLMGVFFCLFTDKTPFLKRKVI